jgi:putative nucleotidyltransferase with HDIG domain
VDSEENFVVELIEDLESGQLQLPTLPEVALRVRDAVEDEASTVNDIANIIATDAALSARLIQIANSPLYRTRDPIDRLPMVVNRLGSRLVRNLVTSQVMKQMFQATTDYVDQKLRAVWEHSVEVASISRVLASQFTRLQPEQAMLAGLLHDIGVLPVLYRAEECPEMLDDTKVFDHLIRTLHPRIGAAILEHWQFPGQLIAVAREHENLTYDHGGAADLVDVIIVANLQSHAGSDHPLADISTANITAFARLGLDSEVDEIELGLSEQAIGEVQEVLA